MSAALAGILSGILQIASVVPYLRGMLRRETKPNLVSFSLWTIIQAIAVVAQVQSGWSWSAVILIAVTINCFLITLLGLKGYGFKRYTRFDIFCLVMAVVSLILWRLTNEPLTALIITFLLNVFATLPTIIKVFKYPDTENSTGWLMMCGASILSLLSITEFTSANLFFPVEFLIESSLIGGTAFLLGRRI